jgi:hypothetical protein
LLVYLHEIGTFDSSAISGISCFRILLVDYVFLFVVVIYIIISQQVVVTYLSILHIKAARGRLPPLVLPSMNLHRLSISSNPHRPSVRLFPRLIGQHPTSVRVPRPPASPAHPPPLKPRSVAHPATRASPASAARHGLPHLNQSTSTSLLFPQAPTSRSHVRH